jgi:hypothetical protein
MTLRFTDQDHPNHKRLEDRKLEIIRFWVYETDQRDGKKSVIEIAEFEYAEDLTPWQLRVLRYNVRTLCRIHYDREIEVSHLFTDGSVEVFK